METADIANNVINQQSEPPLIGDFGAQSSKPPTKKGRVKSMTTDIFLVLPGESMKGLVFEKCSP